MVLRICVKKVDFPRTKIYQLISKRFKKVTSWFMLVVNHTYSQGTKNCKFSIKTRDKAWKPKGFRVSRIKN